VILLQLKLQQWIVHVVIVVTFTARLGVI